MSDDEALLQRALKREKARREKAEQLLEDKSRELYLSYQTLQDSHSQLAAALDEVKSQQRQLVQSEKLASLGTMSAGVAHEINNPLAFVFSNVNSLAHSVDEFRRYHESVSVVLAANDQDARQQAYDELTAYVAKTDLEFLFSDSVDLIDETREGIERVKSIVAGLKAFARTDSGTMEMVDIVECLHTTLKLAHNQIKYNMDVKEAFDAVPQIRGYPGKLSQVFLNLIVNASQAMDSNGQLVIALKSLDERMVQLKFQDNGSGMSQETMDSVFNPFFTTKPVGEGTGLGLSISHGIIEEHNGRIEVASQPGEGTCFTITLPVDGAVVDVVTNGDTGEAGNDAVNDAAIDRQAGNAL